jgi:hypothetical protein
MYLQKVISRKNCFKSDPDPPQNVMVPQHWFLELLDVHFEGGKLTCSFKVFHVGLRVQFLIKKIWFSRLSVHFYNFCPVLRILDVYHGSWNPDQNFSIPDPGSNRFRNPDPRPASKNLIISNPKNLF